MKSRTAPEKWEKWDVLNIMNNGESEGGKNYEKM